MRISISLLRPSLGRSSGALVPDADKTLRRIILCFRGSSRASAPDTGKGGAAKATLSISDTVVDDLKAVALYDRAVTVGATGVFISGISEIADIDVTDACLLCYFFGFDQCGFGGGIHL